MTTQNTPFLDVQQMIAEQCDVEPATVTVETPLESLSIDSLERVELALQLEKHFHITLDDQQVKRCLTVGDVTTLVQDALSVQAGTPPSVKQEE